MAWRYFFGVFLPLISQCFVVILVVALNTGNGSFAGLGAFLIGMFAIPLTTLVNIFYVHKRRELPGLTVAGRCFLIACCAPFFVVALMLFA